MSDTIAQPQTPALTITVTTGSATHQYSEPTVEATVLALRSDILQGTIPRDARFKSETKIGKAKSQITEGTLVKCSSRYAQLRDLYMPVRRYARSGLGYGIITGISINLILLGLLVSQSNSTFGLAIIALPICFAVAVLLVSLKINLPVIQTPCMLAAVILPGYLGINGLFPQLLGAAFSGGVLGCMPGMTIGAIIGAVRLSRIVRAHDAPKENAMLSIVIPLVISIAIWSGYLILARNLLPKLLK